MPLAESAVHEMLRIASEYHDADDSVREHVVEVLRRQTGAESAWIAHSFLGAVRLALEQVDGIARNGWGNSPEWVDGLTGIRNKTRKVADMLVNNAV